MEPVNYNNEVFLMEDFRAGNEDAFRAIFNKLHEKALLQAMRYLPAQEAEDVTTESFIRLWQHKQKFRTHDEVAAYLYTTIKHKCFDHIKHQHRVNARLQLATETETDEPFANESIQLELLTLIYAEVDKLPARMREIFLLSYKEGLKPAEIARRLELSVQTVKNQKITAIRLLKIALSTNSAAVALLHIMQFQG